jgi:tetratricopeptide (TPR) repeat protein
LEFGPVRVSTFGFLSERDHFMSPRIAAWWWKSAIIAVLLAGGAWGSLQIRSYWLGRKAFQSGQRAMANHDFSAAQSEFACCLEYWPQNCEVLLLAVQAARRACDYPAASGGLKAFRRAGGLTDAAELEQILARIQQGDFERGESQLLHAAEQDHPDAAMFLEALARGYLTSFRLDDALTCLNRWLEREPDNVQARVWRADVFARRLSHENALIDYRHALSLAPDRTDIRRDFAHALVEARQPGEALGELEVLRQACPNDSVIMLWIARCQHMKGYAQAAITMLDQVLSTDPGNAAALTEQGKLAFETGNTVQAETYLRKAVQLAPADREALFTLMQALRQNGKQEEAKAEEDHLRKLDAALDRAATLAQSIAVSPHDAGLRHEMALIFLSKGETREGMRWLNSALREDPLYQPALKTLAEQARHGGDAAQEPRAN